MTSTLKEQKLFQINIKVSSDHIADLNKGLTLSTSLESEIGIIKIDINRIPDEECNSKCSDKNADEVHQEEYEKSMFEELACGVQ